MGGPRLTELEEKVLIAELNAVSDCIEVYMTRVSLLLWLGHFGLGWGNGKACLVGGNSIEHGVVMIFNLRVTGRLRIERHAAQYVSELLASPWAK